MLDLTKRYELYDRIIEAYKEMDAPGTVMLLSCMVTEIAVRIVRQSETASEKDILMIAAIIRANTEVIKGIRLDDVDKEMKHLLSGNFISNLEGVKRILFNNMNVKDEWSGFMVDTIYKAMKTGRLRYSEYVYSEPPLDEITAAQLDDKACEVMYQLREMLKVKDNR